MADPDERTPAGRIDATRRAARSLVFLLDAIERGELVATPLEIARLQGAVAARAYSSARPSISLPISCSGAE